MLVYINVQGYCRKTPVVVIRNQLRVDIITNAGTKLYHIAAVTTSQPRNASSLQHTNSHGCSFNNLTLWILCIVSIFKKGIKRFFDGIESINETSRSETVAAPRVGVKDRERWVKLQLHNDSLWGFPILPLSFAVLSFIKHQEPLICST